MILQIDARANFSDHRCERQTLRVSFVVSETNHSGLESRDL